MDLERISAKQSQTPSPKHKSREIRKVEGERDRALGRLHKIKSKRKQKKAQRYRNTLAMQVVSLTMETTRALSDGEI